MTIDALALAALRTETEDKVRGCRIQKIIPTGPLSLVLEAYNAARRERVQFLLSADAQNARVHLLSQKASQQPGEPTPFMLLLRKYVRYGIIDSIEQIPFERIILISIAKKFPAGKRPYFGAAGAAPKEADYNEPEDDSEDEPAENEDFEIYESKLVCEMMGRHSNIMLLSDENIIIDAVKRVAPSKNRYRLILPHQLYVTPPPQNKNNFNLESPASFAARMEQLREKNRQGMLWQVLVETFAGVSPQLGREIAYRQAERKGQNPADTTLDTFQRWDNVYVELRNLLRPLNPAQANKSEEGPAAWLVREEAENVVAFAPYELRQFRPQELEAEAVDSLSLAAEEFYGQVEAIGGQSQRKQEIAGMVGEHHEKLRRRAASLEGSLKKAESAEELKRKGEAIYAHLYEMTPGMPKLEVDGLKIVLDPDRTASENAQAYFREYDKALQALAGVPELLTETKLELEYLDEMLTQLDLAESYDEVVNLKAEFSEAGFGGKTKKKKEGTKSPRPKRRKLPQTPTFTSPDGFTIHVGKSGQHNEYVTFELGDRSDLWLHARGMPGSHVIIKAQGREVPEKTLEMAAALAAYYSKGQTSTKVEVTYAPQRYVRKVKGQHPGLVTYSNDKAISVKPKKPK